MKKKTLLSISLFALVSTLSFSQAHAQQATISISAGGNVNSKGTVEAWCVNSSKSCKVTGNRSHHAGPRSCSMSCRVNDIVVFSCSPNNDDRYIDDFHLPNGATLISQTGSRQAYGAIVSGSASASCSYTD